MITTELKAVILSTLKLDDWDIGADTLASEVPGWDSLSHTTVILAVEEHFKVRFTMAELMRLKTIGELQHLVSSKAG